VRRFIDRVQVWLYLAGFLWLAVFIGKFGTKPALTKPVVFADPNDVIDDEDDIHERDTLPDDVPPGREHLEGPGWRLDEFPPEPLEFVTFDPTFNDNKLIDMGRDIALPHSKLDVN